jgi:glycosyltransferase involved in cell wall biosynthesis
MHDHQQASMAVTPAISVIMPVYNTEQWVGDAVRSILAQTFSDFELIIIDDGSTDGTLQAVRRAVSDDPRVIVMSQANTGIVGALNAGLAQARGEFIARMDGDDLCDPRRFELQIERLRSEPQLVALGTCAIAIDPAGRLLCPADVPLTHEKIEKGHLTGESRIFHPSVMMRAAAVKRAGGYRDLCPVEDFDLWLRLGELGFLANLPQRLFTWRRTATGLLASHARRRVDVLRHVMEEMWKRRGLPGQPPSLQARLMSRGELFRQWGWMALNAGERSTARRYALRSVVAQPMGLDSWWLLAHALRP